MSSNDQNVRKVLSNKQHGELNRRMLDFFAEKSKNCPEITGNEFVREFCNLSGVSADETSLKRKFSKIKNFIPICEYDDVTKIKMMFVGGCVIDDDFLEIINRHGTVKLDKANKIVEFISHDESWKLSRKQSAAKREIERSSYPGSVSFASASSSSFGPSSEKMARRAEVVSNNFQSSLSLMQPNVVSAPMQLSQCQNENLPPPSTNPADHSVHPSEEVIHVMGSNPPKRLPIEGSKSQRLILNQFMKAIEEEKKPTEEELAKILDSEKNKEPEDPMVGRNECIEKKEGPNSSKEEEPTISVTIALNTLCFLANFFNESKLITLQVKDIQDAIKKLGGDKIVLTKKIVEAFRKGFIYMKDVDNATEEEIKESTGFKNLISKLQMVLKCFDKVSIDLQNEIEEEIKNGVDKKVPFRKVSYGIETIFVEIKNLQKLDS